MAIRARFGEWLLAQQLIHPDQLSDALQLKNKTGKKIGQCLIELNIISEKQFLDLFSKYLNIPYFDLKLYDIDPALALQLPVFYANACRAIILKKQGDGFLMGMADPMDVGAVDKLHAFFNKPLSFALVREQDLERTFNLIYRQSKAISGFARSLSQEMKKDIDILPMADNQVDAPVIHLLNTIFRDGVQMNASDIHIEPTGTTLRIRLRIDGVLHEQVVNEQLIMSAIVSRLKLMAELNIAEKRVPQDGRFEIKVMDKKYVIRLSTLPTPFGESVVMRLLPHVQKRVQLSDTGMCGDMLSRMQELIRKPNGIILVTGPTSVGKTTTLYAALNEINRPEISIITIEDPIEYYLPWATQVQTNEKIGLDFATVLRSILRHDPDVILLGEMRDGETSSISMRTALTGRLVFSTLHTNDTLSTVYRLIDLGVEPFMIAATTQGILAQRLMGLICQNCIEDHTLTEPEKIWLSKLNLPYEHIQFKTGKGCSLCANTGFNGRSAIFELLELSTEMAKALRDNNQNAFFDLASQTLANKKLANDAYRLAVSGKTTVADMMRVISEG